MGKALLSENERNSIPILYQKQFMFNLGVLNEHRNDNCIDRLFIERKLC